MNNLDKTKCLGCGSRNTKLNNNPNQARINRSLKVENTPTGGFYLEWHDCSECVTATPVMRRK